jgi:hypothetical protein
VGPDGKITTEKIEDEKKAKQMRLQSKKAKLYAMVLGVALSAATVWW